MAADRLPALDGLRGTAAAVVVVHHSLLVSPALATSYRAGSPEPTGWAWWLTRTPLHLAWAGTEAVYLFFILSGFVLALPFTGPGPRPSWTGYVTRRLLRLYLPVLAAVALGSTVVALVGRDGGADSWWLAAHDVPVTASAVAHDATLVFGTTVLNSALWSLRWEVVFSLLLPLYLLGARLGGRAWWLGGGVLLGLTAVGSRVEVPSLTYLPVFGLGVLMAAHREALLRALARLTAAGWALLAATATGLFTVEWALPATGGAVPVAVTAAALVVVAFLGSPAAVRAGRAPAAQWLGHRSFSLYLVHEPIVVSVAALLPTTGAVLLPAETLLISVPLCLLTAVAFHRLVEAPSHRFSAAVGRQVDGWALHHRRPVGRRGARAALAPHEVSSLRDDDAELQRAGR